MVAKAILFDVHGTLVDSNDCHAWDGVETADVKLFDEYRGGAGVRLRKAGDGSDAAS